MAQVVVKLLGVKVVVGDVVFVVTGETVGEYFGTLVTGGSSNVVGELVGDDDSDAVGACVDTNNMDGETVGG